MMEKTKAALSLTAAPVTKLGRPRSGNRGTKKGSDD